MRVAILVHNSLPHSAAGVEVYSHRLARALQRLGHDVLIVAALHDLAGTPYSTREREYDGVRYVDIINVRHEGTLKATYDNPKMAQAITEVFQTFRPDVAHFNHFINLSITAIENARAAGIATVAMLHDHWLSCPRDGVRMTAEGHLCEAVEHSRCGPCIAESPYIVPVAQRALGGAARAFGAGSLLPRLHSLAPRVTTALMAGLRKASPQSNDWDALLIERRTRILAALDHCDAVLASTSFARDRAIEFGVLESRVRREPVGIVIENHPRRNGRIRRFGFVGTIAPHKGLHVLMDAFSACTRPDISLHVWGGEKAAPLYVEQMKSRAGADPRIQWHGPFSEGEQNSVFAQFDALVLPSIWWENGPFVVMEALAAGLPVIAADTGGVPELSAGGGVTLFRRNDATSLVRALEEVCDLPHRTDIAPQMTVLEGASRLASLYREIVGRGTASR